LLDFVLCGFLIIKTDSEKMWLEAAKAQIAHSVLVVGLSGGATPERARSNDLAGRPTVL